MNGGAGEVILKASVHADRMTLSSTHENRQTRTTEMALSPSLGWTMIQSIVRADSRLASVLSAIGLVCWLLPGGLLLSHASSSTKSIAGLVLKSVGWATAVLALTQSVLALLALQQLAIAETLLAAAGAALGALVGLLPRAQRSEHLYELAK